MSTSSGDSHDLESPGSGEGVEERMASMSDMRDENDKTMTNWEEMNAQQ